MPDKLPLIDVWEAISDEERNWDTRLSIFKRDNPNEPVPPHWAKRAQAFKVATQVLAVMATYEDRSRGFVAQLLKDHAEGR